MRKNLFRIALVAGVSALVSILGFGAFLIVTEFTPSAVSSPEKVGVGSPVPPAGDTLVFLTWNIGYAGLDREMDFFYDGGTRVRPARAASAENLRGIRSFLAGESRRASFILLQEVDRDSKRSWRNDQFADLAAGLPGWAGRFGTNYDCPFVPVPLSGPVGKVLSGVATFSASRPAFSEVRYFRQHVEWPRRLVFLKRCYLVSRYPAKGGRELVVFNVHNSAFDSSGLLRRHEMTLLDSAMRAEYEKGNRVIAGGDWNINPPGFHPGTVAGGDRAVSVQPPFDTTFFKGWRFAFDPARPTNREVNRSYRKGETGTTTIDFFVVSPNVDVLHTEVVPCGFRYSDHEPVRMTVIVNQEINEKSR